MKNFRLTILTPIVLLFGLAGCSGGDGNGSDGGGSTTAPAAPSLNLAIGLKQLQFSWNAVSDATHYRLLENRDGTSGFSQVGGDLTATSAAIDIAVHRHDWANARYLVQACNSAGCTDSNEVNTVGGALQAIGYIKASNTGPNDFFGVSVALSGDGGTLAVAAFGEASSATGINSATGQADDSAPGAGAVYVYVRSSNGTWAQQAYIKASDAHVDDGFGRRVALSYDGNTLAVGTPGESGLDDGSANSIGAVYIYTRSGTTWTEQAQLRSPNPDPFDKFGDDIALSADGDTLAVGVPGESSNATTIDGDQTDNSAARAGAAYVYTRSGGTWTQQAYIKASNAGAGDEFGISVALSADGNTLAVGAHLEDGTDDGSADDAGAAYVYTRSGGTWTQQAYIKASNADADDRYGYSVALSADGNTLAVGAPEEASSATGVNGDETDNFFLGAGAVYVYTRSGGTWTQQAYVKTSNTEAGDDFGWSIALTADGNTLVAAADEEDSSAGGVNVDQNDNSAPFAGAVYVFTRSGGTWSQQAYLKAPNPDANDFFGDAVAVSADGSSIAIGAETEGSSATGIGGDQADNSLTFAGAVYLY